jgi:hypothetical protein
MAAAHCRPARCAVPRHRSRRPFDSGCSAIQINDWQTARDVACRIGGPNPSFGPLNCYSQAHYEKIGGALPNLDRYKIVFVDSVTAVSRLSYRHAEQQPEARSDRTGVKDTRAAYGLHARELLLWLHQLQHARDKHVIFVGILERQTDNLNRFLGYEVQMEGAKVPREIGAIVDEFIIMNWIEFEGRDEPARAFICTSPNRWSYPAKDRSGRLEQIEEPHLGKLLRKIVGQRQSDPTLKA